MNTSNLIQSLKEVIEERRLRNLPDYREMQEKRPLAKEVDLKEEPAFQASKKCEKAKKLINELEKLLREI